MIAHPSHKKNPYDYKLNSIFLNNPWIKKEIKNDTMIYLELKDSKNIKCKNCGI